MKSALLTHLDVYRWVFSEPNRYPLIDDGFDISSCHDLLHDIFSALEQTSVLLEINAAPLYKGFDGKGSYPERKIMQLAQKYNLNYIFGSDAHEARFVGYGYEQLYNVVEYQGSAAFLKREKQYSIS